MDLFHLLLRCTFLVIVVYLKITACHFSRFSSMRNSPVKRSANRSGWESHMSRIRNNHHSPRELNRGPAEPMDAIPASTDRSASSEIENGNCPKCNLRKEQIKQMRIEQIKYSILSSLRMDRIPNTTLSSKLLASPEVRRMIHQSHSRRPSRRHHLMQNDQGVGPSATVQRMVLFPQRPSLEQGTSDPTFLTFKVTNRLTEYNAKEALLHIYLHKSTIPLGASQNLTVNQVYGYSEERRTHKIKFVMDKAVSLDPRRGQWVVIDARTIVQDWMERSDMDSLILQIQLADQNNNLINQYIDSDVDIDNPKRPYIALSLKLKPHLRFKREVDDICTEDQPRETCCRYPLVINFQQLEWDFILSPTSYNAYLCEGSCPINHRKETTYTYLLSSLVHSGNTLSSGPCCAPKEWDFLDLIYNDDNNNVQANSIPQMVVMSCGCV